MPDTTPNYGWRIPKFDGTDYIIPDDVRVPVSSIDTQMKAEETARLANTSSINNLGTWQDVTGMTICTDVSLTAQAGSSVSRARWMKIGKTIWYIGYGGSGSAASICAVSLPIAAAGTPKTREYNCGTVVATGAAVPAQAGVGFMGPANDRLIVVNIANSYISCPASSGIRWSVMYEVN